MHSSWPRRAARVSIIAALVCFTLQCTLFQLTAPKVPKPNAAEAEAAQPISRARPAVQRLVDSAGMALIVGGFVLGVAGLVGGVRERSSDIIAMALIGLFLNGGVLAIVGWYFLILRPQFAPLAN